MQSAQVELKRWTSVSPCREEVSELVEELEGVRVGIQRAHQSVAPRVRAQWGKHQMEEVKLPY